jgi:hypothetical protein
MFKLDQEDTEFCGLDVKNELQTRHLTAKYDAGDVS